MKKYVRWWLGCRLSNRKVCFIYCRCYCSVCRYYCCSPFCFLETVRGFTTEYLDLLNINSYYTVRCCMTYEYAFVYIRHVLLLLLPFTVLLYCCCSSSCCLLLLFDKVCRMANIFAVVHCIWFHCNTSLHSNTIYFHSTPWQYCVPFTAPTSYLLCNTYNIIHPR